MSRSTRPEWISAYLRAFERHSRMMFTASAGEEFRALLPMVESNRLLRFLPARVLRSPSNIYSSDLDRIADEVISVLTTTY